MLLRTMKLLFSFEQVRQNIEQTSLAAVAAFSMFSCFLLVPALIFASYSHLRQPTANQNDIDDSELAGVCFVLKSERLISRVP